MVKSSPGVDSHLPAGRGAAGHLVASAQDSGLSSQTQTDGAHDAGLAGSIGSNDHVQIWSGKQHGVVVSAVGSTGGGVIVLIGEIVAGWRQRAAGLRC